MVTVEEFLKEATKAFGISEDINRIKEYIGDIRLCFVLITVSSYLAVLIYFFLVLCKFVRNPCKSVQLQNDENRTSSTKRLGNGGVPLGKGSRVKYIFSETDSAERAKIVDI